MKLSIIIPVYNEQKTILRILDKIEKVKLPNGIAKEIIIIDDFSTDNTRTIVAKLENKYRIIYHNKNYGKGAAIKSGLNKCGGDLILIQDADLEYNPAEYPKLLQPILDNTAKVVYGNRLTHSNVHRYKLYYFGNIFLSFLFSVLYQKRIKDMETCYKIIHKDVLNNIKIKSNRFNFEPEITAKIVKAKYAIKEIPIQYHSRSINDGKKINWRDGIIAIFTIIRYRFFN